VAGACSSTSRARQSKSRHRPTLKLVTASIQHVEVTSVRSLRGTYGGMTYRVARRFLAPPDERETTHELKPAADAARDKQTTLFTA
jgi:hypothetical protein